jgi:DNA-binding transcriptional MerR regulator
MPEGLLKMSELAEASGVSTGTIKHYLREGLLGDGDEIVRTSRNMAYYPPDYVERIRLIKRLQEERFLPLRHIRDVLDVAARNGDDALVSRDAAAERHRVPANVLARLEDLGVLSAGGYDADDERIVAAIARFRAGGYDESLGFTVYDTLRYRDALAPLVDEEVRTLLDRLAGEVSVERAVEIIASGAEPLRELIGAMHSRMLRGELRRRREDA